MEKYINEYERECYRGVEKSTLFGSLDFHLVKERFGDDIQHALHTNLGSLTVVDRKTGFGWQDIETDYRAPNGEFWLASGGYDVRKSGAKTIQDAIDWVKKHANTYIGKED